MPELQRLTKEAAQIKESIIDLKNILQVFGDQIVLVREKLEDAESKYKDDNEILQTCSKLALHDWLQKGEQEIPIGLH